MSTLGGMAPAATGSAGRFDAVAYKAAQRTTWNAISDGWARWQERYEDAARPVTEWLLDAAGVGLGCVVLDAGTGTGEPALAAAHRVGPAGRVVGVDLAPAMLEQARQRAGTIANVQFVEGDLEALDFPPASFDAVLSRWGLMFAVDPVAALRSLRRLLAPGGVLAAAVWGAPAANPMTRLGYQVLSQVLELPAPPAGTPGPFSLSEPGAVRDAATVAGFVEPSISELPLCLRFASVTEYVAFTRAVIPPELREALRQRFGRAADGRTEDALAEAASAYPDGAGGVALPGLALCLRAVRPAGP